MGIAAVIGLNFSWMDNVPLLFIAAASSYLLSFALIVFLNAIPLICEYFILTCYRYFLVACNEYVTLMRFHHLFDGINSAVG